MKKSNQQGFTLIELIIVIVILGILAVTASPKFLDIQSDARASTLEGVEASLKGAVNIAYSKALIQGVTGTAATPESTSSPEIPMVYGYPDATTASIELLIETGDWIVNTVETGGAGTVRIYPGEGGYNGASATVFTDDGPDGDNSTGCYVSYLEAADADTAPVIDLVSTGC